MYYSTTKKLGSKNKKNYRGPSLALGNGDLCRGSSQWPSAKKIFLKKNKYSSFCFSFPTLCSFPTLVVPPPHRAHPHRAPQPPPPPARLLLPSTASAFAAHRPAHRPRRGASRPSQCSARTAAARRPTAASPPPLAPPQYLALRTLSLPDLAPRSALRARCRRPRCVNRRLLASAISFAAALGFPTSIRL